MLNNENQRDSHRSSIIKKNEETPKDVFVEDIEEDNLFYVPTLVDIKRRDFHINSFKNSQISNNLVNLNDSLQSSARRSKRDSIRGGSVILTPHATPINNLYDTN